MGDTWTVGVVATAGLAHDLLDHLTEDLRGELDGSWRVEGSTDAPRLP